MLKKRVFSRKRKGRPHTRWLDNVMIGVTGWGGRVEDRAGWRKSIKGCSASAAADAVYNGDDDEEEEEEMEI